MANLTLNGLEIVLQKRFPCKWAATGSVDIRNPKINLVRYADDFVVTGISREVLENEVRPLIEQFLAERGLVLSPEKTKITHINDGFDFLGQNLRRFGGKLLIRPSQKNAQAFLQKIRTILRDNPATSQESLIWNLNPVIRGWVNYHRFITSTKAFQRLDWEIWRSLWRWARRRHPDKGRRWCAKRYWHAIGSRQWTFAVNLAVGFIGEKPDWLRLVYATDTPMRRHLKIRSDANPFDPAWDDYFEAREILKRSGRTTRWSGQSVVDTGPAHAGL